MYFQKQLTLNDVQQLKWSLKVTEDVGYKAIGKYSAWHGNQNYDPPCRSCFWI